MENKIQNIEEKLDKLSEELAILKKYIKYITPIYNPFLNPCIIQDLRDKLFKEKTDIIIDIPLLYNGKLDNLYPNIETLFIDEPALE